MRFRKSHDVAVDEENPYWMSFSDIMSALLVIFILASVILILQLMDIQQKLEERQVQFEQEIEELKKAEQVRRTILDEAVVGLTVVGANHVVHLERHWNPAKEAQASDRVYRIGQQKEVFIHLPAVTHPQFDSFDVHLDRLLRGKLMLKDAVVTPEAVSESEMIYSMGL